jgi:cell division protein FtsA
VRNGAVYHTAVIPFGGNHITNDIAAGLRTPVAAAEEIKRKFGIAMVSLVGRDETIEVPSTGDHAPRVLSKVLLAEIIEPRVTEMFALVAKELQKANVEGLVTSGVVLSGGCAALLGIHRVAEQVFNLPVRVGAARPVGGLNDLIASPEYSTAVGLVLYGAGSAASNYGRSAGNRGVGQLMQRVSSWLSDRF